MSEIKTYSLDLHVEDDHLWAEVVELPGCFVTGSNLKELAEALAEAIPMYLSPSSSTTKVAHVTLTEDPPVRRKMPARVELVHC